MNGPIDVENRGLNEDDEESKFIITFNEQLELLIIMVWIYLISR
jgi:hypothetical protein